MTLTTVKEPIFHKPITEIIKKRTSIRSYKKEEVAGELKEKLNSYLSKVQGPLDSAFRFKIIDRDAALKESGAKLGTYGVIKGASSFIAGVIEKGGCEENFGYVLEKIILYATSLGLGTCWLAGTFRKGEFAKELKVEEGEILPAITPIGYESEKKGTIDSLVRKVSGADQRKEWKELFYHIDFAQNLSHGEAGVYMPAIEMIRLAPSASNKQPWRIVKDRDTFHFFLEHAKGYGEKFGFDVQKIDIGIAMCHFEMTLQELGIEGQWVQQKPNIQYLPGDIEYRISWVKK